MQTPFTTQSLNNMLSQMGITVPPGTNMQLKNVGGHGHREIVAFARTGQSVDIVVSQWVTRKAYVVVRC